MLSPRVGTPGRCGAFDFSEEFLIKIPTMGTQNLVKSDQISPGGPSIYIESEDSEVVFLYKYKNKFLPLLKAAVFQGFTKGPKTALLQFQDPVGAALVRFLNGRCHFRDTKNIF